jgi:hypothetical protein
VYRLQDIEAISQQTMPSLALSAPATKEEKQKYVLLVKPCSV